MNRSDKLKPIVQHTSNLEQEALQAMAVSQDSLAQEQNKLAQLKDYKSEYLQKEQQQNSVYSSLDLQELHRFIEQLDETILKQKSIINQSMQELDTKRQCWSESRIDSKAMDKVLENLQQKEFIVEQRLEQKVMDEFSQRKNLHF